MSFLAVKGNFVIKGYVLIPKQYQFFCAGSRLLKINLMDTTKKLKPSGRKR